jgi:nicotinic acetylcholine receptor
VELEVYQSDIDWNLDRFTVERNRPEFNYGYFPTLLYTVYIRRRPFFYVVNLVIPTLLLTLTALIGFHMPSSGNGMHQEKVD